MRIFAFLALFTAAPAFADHCVADISAGNPVMLYSCGGGKTTKVNASELKVDENEELQVQSAALTYFQTKGYTTIQCENGEEELKCIFKK